MALSKSATAILAVGAILLPPASAQTSSDEYVIIGSHIDNVRQQKSIFQTADDCENNPACVVLAKVVSAATEIPVDKFITALATLSGSTEGEGTFTKIALPAGYSYCAASMQLVSIVPHDGDRGSTFLGRADADGLYTETWTPVLPPFEGRSWVEADLTVIGVRSDLAQLNYANGRCRPPGRAIFYCRGGGCEGGAVDKGQSVDTSSPPGAGSRK